MFIGKIDGVGPGDVLARVRACAGVTHNLQAVIYNTVILSVFVPLGPPAGIDVGLRAIIGVTAEKMSVIETGGIGVGAGTGRLIKVDRNKVPLCAEHALGVIANKEKAVRRIKNGLVQVGGTAWYGKRIESGRFLGCAKDGFIVDIASSSDASGIIGERRQW